MSVFYNRHRASKADAGYEIVKDSELGLRGDFGKPAEIIKPIKAALHGIRTTQNGATNLSFQAFQDYLRNILKKSVV